MARPKKNNADYFPHDADMRNNRKIRALRRKYGLDGYAIYNMVLETICDRDFFNVDINPIEMELLAGDYEIDLERLKSIINYMQTINLIQINSDTMVCLQQQERLGSVLKRRKPDDTGVIVNTNPQSKVKESKGKESNKTSSYSDEFEIIWKAMAKRKGKKSGKAPAFKLWQSLKPPFDKTLAMIEALKATPEWIKENGAFIPDLQKLLRAKFWDDDLPESGNQDRSEYGFAK